MAGGRDTSMILHSTSLKRSRFIGVPPILRRRMGPSLRRTATYLKGKALYHPSFVYNPSDQVCYLVGSLAALGHPYIFKKCLLAGFVALPIIVDYVLV